MIKLIDCIFIKLCFVIYFTIVAFYDIVILNYFKKQKIYIIYGLLILNKKVKIQDVGV
jgi:hypothetical protein